MDERLGERRKKKEGRETTKSERCERRRTRDVSDARYVRGTVSERADDKSDSRRRGLHLSLFFRRLVIPREYVDDTRASALGTFLCSTRALFPAIFRCWTKKIPAPRRFFVPPCFRRIAQSRCAHHIHGRGRSALGGVGVRGGRVVNDGEDRRGGAHTERANSEVSLATRSRREKAPRACDQGKQPDARSASHASSASRASRIRLRVEYRRVSRSAS